ncbi:MAG: prephenate dehydrogenase/arogenate dehydrogenase family protein [Candidatus Bathyarchaeia archaeon]
MRVAIIGGGGKMGSWFARYFDSRGYSVSISDINKNSAKLVADSLGIEMAESNREAVTDADIVLVSVPINSVIDVISGLEPYMSDDSVLIEISSIKSGIVPQLSNIVRDSITTVSLHPMFGPAVEGIKDRTIAVSPVASEEREVSISRCLFEEAKIFVVGHKEHDNIMAVNLSLTYCLNVAFSGVLDDLDLDILKRLGGTTFPVQLALAESVINEEPDLVYHLIRENQFSGFYLNEFMNKFNHLREALDNKEAFDEFYNRLKLSLERDPDYRYADERRYKAFKALED